MSKFEDAISTVLKHEGGYVDNPNDPGGVTNWGISIRFLKAQGQAGVEVADVDGDGELEHHEIRAMTEEQAKRIYRQFWWDKYRYSLLDEQEVATKVFDLSVNMGAKQAHKLAQRACRANHVTLTEDGILGPKSVAAINSIPASMFLPALRSEQAGFYRLLAAKRPKLAVFLKGWLRRAYT